MKIVIINKMISQVTDSVINVSFLKKSYPLEGIFQ